MSNEENAMARKPVFGRFRPTGTTSPRKKVD
jgi:hypothetical protein